MSAAILELSSRRSHCQPDGASVICNLAEGADVLTAMFASWPHKFVREADIIGAERNLVEMQRLLIELRSFVPATERSA